MKLQLWMLFLSFLFGLAVSCGFIAFVILIGILPRLISKTRTAQHVVFFETCFVVGTALGNVCVLYKTPLPFEKIGALLLGLLFGFFVGCLSGALAEVVKIFPILTRRLHLRTGLPYVIGAIALGKCFGTLLQFFVIQ